MSILVSVFDIGVYSKLTKLIKRQNGDSHFDSTNQTVLRTLFR